MNLKKTAIALAVASVAATPIAASADGKIYASARFGLQYADLGTIDSDGTNITINDSQDEFTVQNWASRMGMKGKTDLGNGTTAFGRYEFSVGSANSGSVGTRHAYVGLENDHWGSVTIGKTYHTFYNFIRAETDKPWWGAGTYMVYTASRAEALTYANNFGTVSVGLTAYMDEGGNTDANGDPESFDKIEGGISFDAGPVTIAGAIVTEQGSGTPENIYALAASSQISPYISLAGNFMIQGTSDDKDATSFTLQADIGSFYAHLEICDKDGSADNKLCGNDDIGTAANDITVTGDKPIALTLGYTHTLGPRTTMWFELESRDADIDSSTANASDADGLFIRAALKYDIL